MDTPSQLRPFRETPRVPVSLAIPSWLSATVLVAVGAGVLAGLLTERGTAGRISRVTFFASAFAYLCTSLLDFAEHLRMEKVVTGHYLRFTVVPLGETINHGLTIATLVAIFVLARPLPVTLHSRDYFVLAAPALFLILGWRDEIVYHRRRSLHREDIMHTVSHLAAGAMLTAFYIARLATG